MGFHDNPGESSFGEAEPAAFAEGIRALIAIVVGAGWLTLDTGTVNWIITVAGLLASAALTWRTRSKVTPVAEARDSNGTRLVPMRPPPPAS